MRRFTDRRFGAVVCCAVSVVIAAQPSYARCSSSLLPTPDVGFGTNELRGISGTDNSDVWAAGWYQHDGLRQTLIERYDGSSWAIVTSPNDLEHPDDFLTAVSSQSPSDAWVVGGMGPHCNCFYEGRPFAAHWDGSMWSEVPVPRAITGFGSSEYLTSVSVNPTDPDDVWAVGWVTGPNSPSFTYAWHWNGRRWSIYPLQSPLYGPVVSSVSTAPDGEAWAVGTYLGRGRDWSIYHWNGLQWSPQDSVGTHDNLAAITAISLDDVWAVGTRIEHFNGQTWQPSHRPDALNQLTSVSALTATDVWAAGLDESVGHYNGTDWFVVPQPAVGTRSMLTGIQALPNGAITAGLRQAPHSVEYRTLSTLTTCKL